MSQDQGATADELIPHHQDNSLENNTGAAQDEVVVVHSTIEDSLEATIEHYHDEIVDDDHHHSENKHKHHPNNRKNKAKKVFATSQFFGSNNSRGASSHEEQVSSEEHQDEEEYFHSEEVAYHFKGRQFVVRSNSNQPNQQPNRTKPKKQHHHKHNNYYQRPKTKEEYVLANFHFVLRPLTQSNTNIINQQFHSNEYNQGKTDPDMLVDWDTIELVIQQTHDQNVECPICLDTFKAPKMTKCGHVFCYPCIVRHVAMGETNYRKCPLCNESVYIDALRSVRIEKKKKFKEGDKMNFVLLKRDKKLIIPDLVSELTTIKENVPSKELSTIYPVDGDCESSKFCRFNVTYDISEILEKELSDLDNSLKTSESIAESEFITLAKDQVIQRRKDWIEWTKTNLTKGRPTTQPTKKISQKADVRDDNVEKKKTEIEDYWYYQSTDCQMIFLHPLCSKMLMHEFKDYVNFPTSLGDCPILEIETVELNEELRRKLPILKHVPCGCYISLVEIDMRTVVSKETINIFLKDIKQRKYRRDEKVRMRIREEQEEKRNEERRKEEEKLDRERLIQELHISNFPELITSPPPVNSDIHFPTTFKTNNITPQQEKPKSTKSGKNDWSKRKQHIEISQASSSSNTPVQLKGAWAQKSTQPSSTNAQTNSSSKKDDFPTIQSKPKKK